MPRPVRQLLPRLVATLGVLGLLLGACSGSSTADGDATPTSGDRSTPPAGPWTFTDDFGVTHELDATPQVIVAEASMAGALWDFGIEVDATFGARELPDGTTDPMGLADPSGMESLGEIYGQVNTERLRLLQPDVVITSSSADGVYWGIDDSIVDEVEGAAPLVVISSEGRTLDETAARVGDLAEALGADLDGEQVTEARAAYDRAVADLRAALAEKPDLSFIAMSSDIESLYVAVPDDFDDLRTYLELGMDIVVPDTDDQHWQRLSWEEADTYAADVVLADSRGGSVEQLRDILPDAVLDFAPVAAGQLARWELVLAPGWANLARVLDDLTDVVEQADPDIIP